MTLRAWSSGSLLGLAVAMATTLAAAPAAAAPLADAEPAVSVNLELPANHGLRAFLKSDDDGTQLEFRRHGRFVSYRVDGEATPAGLKVRFGKLGLIDVAFEPTKTLSTASPPPRCKGEPRTRREGFFSGTIEFNGERGFVQVDASRVKGRMRVYPEWQCPKAKGPIRVPGPSFSPLRSLSRPGPGGALATTSRSEPEAETATLSAFDRRYCRCGFIAYALPDSDGHRLTYLLGGGSETREGMTIGRLTFARARPRAFVFDHVAGTATVRPPAPFSGAATFKRRPHARDLWRSTIRVPLLGARTLGVRGRAFRAALSRELPGD